MTKGKASVAGWEKLAEVEEECEKKLDEVREEGVKEGEARAEVKLNIAKSQMNTIKADLEYAKEKLDKLKEKDEALKEKYYEAHREATEKGREVDDLKKKIADSTSSFSRQLKDSSNDIDSLRRTKKTSADTITSLKASLQAKTNQLEALKNETNGVNETISALQGQFSGVVKEKDEAIEKLEREKEELKSTNQQVLGQLNKFQSALDTVQADAKTVIAQRDSEISDLKAQLSAATENSSSTVKEIQTKLNASQAQKTQLKSAVIQGKKEMESVKQKTKAEMEAMREKGRKEVAELERTISKNERILQQYSKKLEDAINKNKGGCEEIAGLNKQLAAAKKNMLSKSKANEELEAELKSTTKDLEAATSQCEKVLEQVTKTTSEMSDRHREEVQGLKKQMADAKQQIADTEDGASKASKEHEQEVRNITTALQSSHEADTKRLRAELNSAACALEAAEAKFEKTRAKLAQKHATDIIEAVKGANKENSTHHMRELNALQAEHREEVESLKSQTSQHVDEIQATLKANFDKRVESYQSEVERQASEGSSKDAQLAVHMGRVKELEETLREIKVTHAEGIEATKASHEGEASKLWAEKEHAIKEVGKQQIVEQAAQRKNYENKLKEVKDIHEKEMEKQADAHKKETENQADAHREEMQEQMDLLKSTVTDQFDSKLMSTLQETNERHHEDVAAAKAKHEGAVESMSEANERLVEQIRSTHGEEVKRMMTEHSREVEGINNRHNKDTANLVVAHEGKLGEIRIKHKEALDELRDNVEKVGKDSEAIQVAEVSKLKEEISKLKEGHKGEIDKMSKGHDGFIASLNASHSSAMNNNKQGLIKLLDDQSKEFEAERATRKAELAKQEQVAEELRKQIANLKISHGSNVEKVNNDFKEKMNQTNAEYERALACNEKQEEGRIAELKLEHQREITKLTLSLEKEIKGEMARGKIEDITSLKAAHQTATDELINKHNATSGEYESALARLKEEHTEVVTLMRRSNEKNVNELVDTHDRQMQVLQNKLSATANEYESQINTLQTQLQQLDGKYDDTSKTHSNLIQQWRDLQDQLSTIQQKHEVEVEGLTEKKLELELANGGMSGDIKKLKTLVEELTGERDGAVGTSAVLQEQMGMLEGDLESKIRTQNEKFAGRFTELKTIMASKDAANRETLENLESCHAVEANSMRSEVEAAAVEKAKVERNVLASEKFREGGNAARNGVCSMFLTVLEEFDKTQGLTNVKSIFVNDKETEFGENDCVGIVDAVKSWARKKEDKISFLAKEKEEYQMRVREGAEGDRKKEIAVVKAWEEEVKKLRVDWDLKLAAKTFVAACRGFRMRADKAKIGWGFGQWRAAVVVIKAEDSRRVDFADFRKKINFSRAIEKLQFVVKNVDCLLMIKVYKGWVRFVEIEKERESELEERRIVAKAGREVGVRPEIESDAEDEYEDDEDDNISMTSTIATHDMPKAVLQRSPENIKALKRQLVQEKAARKAILAKAAQKWISPSKVVEDGDFEDDINKAVLEGNSKEVEALLKGSYRNGTDLALERLLLLHRCVSGFHFHGNQSLLLGTIEVLLNNCFNINASDTHGNTILHKCLQVCTSNVVISVLKFLLKRGIDVNAVNDGGESGIHVEIRRMRSKSVEVIGLLLNYRARADIVARDGETQIGLVLKYAQKRGTGEAGEASSFVSSGGGSVRTTNTRGSVSGEYGGRNFWVRVALTLLRNGATWDPDYRDRKGRNQLMMLFTGPPPPIGDANSHREVLKHCLGSKTFHVNESDKDGRTVLFLFCLRESAMKKSACISSLGIFEDLLGAGADINAADCEGVGVLNIVGGTKDNGMDLLIPSLVEALNGNSTRYCKNVRNVVNELQMKKEKVAEGRRRRGRRVQVYEGDGPRTPVMKRRGGRGDGMDKEQPASIFRTPTTGKKLMGALKGGREGTPKGEVGKLWERSVGKDFSSRLNSMR